MICDQHIVTDHTMLHAAADGQEEKLCIDKLACHRNVPPPRQPAVLVSCGSFNPPTIMHLRMFDLATAALAEVGCVCGGGGGEGGLVGV